MPNKTTHQAVQPLALPEKYIKACTAIGDIVVDPWLGSGTTGEAAVALDVRVGHNCPICRANYKKLDWKSKVLTPNPFV